MALVGPADPQEFRSGFVALLGAPNVGKSTLVNALLEFDLAIVSSKAQTTRDRIRGIYNDDACQIVFVDTPGVMEPRDVFNKGLRDSALEALQDSDVVYHLIEAARPEPLPEVAAEALQRLDQPVVLVVNKTDLVPGFTPGGDPSILPKASDFPFPTHFYRGVYFISARERFGLKWLIDGTRALLPAAPPMYDTDEVTDRDLRFLSAEIVREKVLANTEQEVPYSVATRTEEFIEREESKHRSRVVIYVEHESQKAILIGRDGSMLRKIGSEARPRIEAICDHPVFLELWVKVLKNWRKRDDVLREFGYKPRSAKAGKRRKRKRR